MEFKTVRVADLSGNVMKSADVRVYRANTTTEVTVFDEAGVALTTAQLKTDANGAFGFKTFNGVYDIVASLGSTTATIQNVQFNDPPIYATVAAFSADVTAGYTAPDGTVVSAGPVQFQADSSASVTGLPAGWVPFGSVTPNHFADNATPGTTDMSAAWQAAVNASAAAVGTGAGVAQNAFAEVHGLAQEYRINSTIKITSGQDGVRLIGNGARMISAVAGACIQIGDDALFTGGDTAGTGDNFNGRVTGFTFAVATGNSTTSIAIRAGKCPGWSIDDNVFFDFYIAIDGHRFNGRQIVNNFFILNTRTVPALAHIRLQGVFDSTNVYTPGGGIHCNNNEFWGYAGDYTMLPHGVLILTVDGFYHHSNHYVYYGEAGLSIAPDGGTRNNVVIDVLSGGANYFDAGSGVTRNVQLVGEVSYAGTSGQANGQYNNISFAANDLFRGNGTIRQGLVVQVTDGGGFTAARGGVTGISVADCKFGEHTITSIVMNGPNIDPTYVPVVDPKISNNRFYKGRLNGTAGGTSYLSLDVDGCTVTDNTLETEETQADRSVLINMTGYTAPGLVFANNDMTSVDVSVSEYLITKPANAVTIIGPNNTPNGMRDENTSDFATIGAFETAVTNGYTKPNGAVISAGRVKFQANSAATVTGLPVGWIPFGDTTPNHFADNVTPGTTDMSVALRNFAAYMKTIGGVGRLLGEVYEFNQSGGFLDVDGWVLKGTEGFSEIHSNTSNVNKTCIVSGAGGLVDGVIFSGYALVSYDTGTNIGYQNCRITNEENFPASARNGVTVEASATINGFVLKGCEIDHVNLGMFTAGVFSVTNFDVSGNTVHDTLKVGLSFNSDPDAGGVADAWDGGVISGNIFYDFYGGSGNRSTAIGGESIVNATVSGNTIRGYGVETGTGGVAGVAEYAIHFESYCRNITISGNNISECDRGVTWFGGDTNNITVTGNTVISKSGRTFADDPSTYTNPTIGYSTSKNAFWATNDAAGIGDAVNLTSNVAQGFDVGYRVEGANGLICSSNTAALCTVAYSMGSSSHDTSVSGNIADTCRYLYAPTGNANAMIGRNKAINCTDIVYNLASVMVLPDGVEWITRATLPSSATTNVDLFTEPEWVDGVTVTSLTYVVGAEPSVQVFDLTYEATVFTTSARKNYLSTPRASLAATTPFAVTFGVFEVRVFNSDIDDTNGRIALNFNGPMLWQGLT